MNGIEKVELINFRCFRYHTIYFSEIVSLIVGKNNAGKSTLIEALKIISFAIQKAKSKNFSNSTTIFDIPSKYKGIKLRLDELGIDIQNLFFRYGDPPAKIVAFFKGGSRSEIQISKDDNFTTFFDPKGRNITCKSDATEILPNIFVMPQPGPLLHEEQLRDRDYVKQNISSRRSVLHFRNQLVIYNDDFEKFKSILPTTWAHLNINELIIPEHAFEGENLSLLVSEGDFTAEVAWMGHGVQVWLQTVWFLCRTSPEAILILDEPDVYLHADLQRKLIRVLLDDNRRQVIIATHSAEMLSEVKANSVIILNRQNRVSQKATSNDALQTILDNVGSIHNLSLMRIGIYRRILLVEGNDISFLKNFQNIFMPHAEVSIDVIPNSSTGGWTGWPAIKTMATFFNKNTESSIKVFCIFDRDYHTDEEIEERKAEAKDLKISIHIWEKKEIENYLIVPSVITRLIENNKKPECMEPISEEITKTHIKEFLDDERENIVDRFSEAFRQQDKSKDNATCNRKARKFVTPYYTENKVSNIVNGKDFFAEIARWAKTKYNVSISHNAIFSEMHAAEVAEEIKEVIEEITK